MPSLAAPPGAPGPSCAARPAGGTPSVGSRVTARSLVASILAACCVAIALLGSSGAADAATPGANALAWAETKVGVPYLWGGEDDNGYDCSGLVMRAYQQVGISLTHQSAIQYQETSNHPVSVGALQPGDLMFYGSTASTIHHVGIFAYYQDGEPWMLDAQQTGTPVNFHHMYSDFYAATRPAGGDGTSPPPAAPRPTIQAPATVAANHAVTISGTAGPSATVQVYSSAIGDSSSTLQATTTAGATGSWSYSVTLQHTRRFAAVTSAGTSPTVIVKAIWPLTMNAPATDPEGTSYYVWGHITDYSDVTVYGAQGPGAGGYTALGTITAGGTGKWALKVAPGTTMRFYATADGQTSKVVQTNILRYPTLTAPQAAVVGASTKLSGTATSLARLTVYFRRGSGPWAAAGSTTVNAARGWGMSATQHSQVSAYAQAAGLKSAVSVIRYIYAPTVQAPATISLAGAVTIKGTGPAGWSVSLYGAPAGSGSYYLIGTSRSDAAGHWRILVQQNKSMQWYVTVLGVKSRIVSTKIVSATPTTIKATATRIVTGTRVSFQGTAAKRAKVTVMAAAPGGRYVAIGTTASDSSGRWSYRTALTASRSVYAVAGSVRSAAVTTTVVRRPSISVPATVDANTRMTVSGRAGAGSRVSVSYTNAVTRWRTFATTTASAGGTWSVRASLSRSASLRATADGARTWHTDTRVLWHPTLSAPATVPLMTTYRLSGHAGRGSAIALYAKGSHASRFAKVASGKADANGSFAFRRTARDDYRYQVHGDYVGSVITSKVGVTAKVPALAHRGTRSTATIAVSGTARPGATVTLAKRFSPTGIWRNGCNVNANTAGAWSCKTAATSTVWWRVGSSNGALYTPAHATQVLK